MNDLNPDLHNRMREALSESDYFETDQKLRVLFEDSRLATWRSFLRSTDTLSNRLDTTIAFLKNRRHQDGENALVLLLQVLSERVHPGDVLQARLAELVQQLQVVLGGEAHSSSTMPEPNPQQESMVTIVTDEKSLRYTRAVRDVGLQLEYRFYSTQKCFVGHSQQAVWRDDVLSALAKVLPQFDLEPWYAAEHFEPTKTLRDKVAELIANSRYGIYDLSSWQDKNGAWHQPRNVFIELGMAIVLNRPTLLLRHTSNSSWPLPACLEGIELIEFAGETTLIKALEERLPHWIDVPPEQEWWNRFCIFGNRKCSFRETHPRERQWQHETLMCHLADGLDGAHSAFRQVERDEIRECFEAVFERYNDMSFGYLDELSLTEGYQFRLCSHCQSVRSTPFAIYHITPQAPAEVYITLGMSIALEKIFEYQIPKVLLVRRESDLPSLLRGYDVVEVGNSSEMKKKLKAFVPKVMRQVRETVWMGRPLPFMSFIQQIDAAPDKDDFRNSDTIVTNQILIWEEAERLIRQTVDNNEDLVLNISIARKLFMLTGGHADLLRVSYVSFIRSGEILPEDNEAAIRVLLAIRRIGIECQRIWEEFRVEERQLLFSQANNLLLPTQEEGPILKALESKGFLQHGQLFSPLFKQFIQRQEALWEQLFYLEEAPSRVWIMGQPVSLTPLEFRLFRLLYQRQGDVVVKDDLVGAGWPDAQGGVSDEAIAAAIARLRRKIEPDSRSPRFIQNVHNQGYILRSVESDIGKDTRTLRDISQSVYFDEPARQIWILGKTVPMLTELEFRLFRLLYRRANTIVTRDELMEAGWPEARGGVSGEVVIAALARLRRKIEPDPKNPSFIQSIPNQGYVLKIEDAEKLDLLDPAMGSTVIGIPANLNNLIRQALFDCGPFENNREIRDVFADERLNTFRNNLPEVDTMTGRIEAIMAYLHDKHRADTGENALVLLLQVLRDRTDPSDACHQRLASLVGELRARWQRQEDVSQTEIGQLLKESREEAAYSMKGVVDLLKKKELKLSVGTWYNVEHGRRLPNESWLEPFANLPRMRVKLEDLRAALYRDELSVTPNDAQTLRRNIAVKAASPQEALKIMLFDPATRQWVPETTFSIPLHVPNQRIAQEIGFDIQLTNAGNSSAREPVIEMILTSSTDAFWKYGYQDRKALVVENAPREWRISSTNDRLEFEGGADFVCHGQGQRHLGTVKMMVPYGQPETTVTFNYRIQAEGHSSQGSFTVVLKPEVGA